MSDSSDNTFEVRVLRQGMPGERSHWERFRVAHTADMNLNRYLDYRENVEQAWHRLGLLKPGEKFTRSTYRACVEDTVAKLQSENFISARVAVMYIEEAEKDDLPGL